MIRIIETTVTGSGFPLRPHSHPHPLGIHLVLASWHSHISSSSCDPGQTPPHLIYLELDGAACSEGPFQIKCISMLQLLFCGSDAWSQSPIPYTPSLVHSSRSCIYCCWLVRAWNVGRWGYLQSIPGKGQGCKRWDFSFNPSVGSILPQHRHSVACIRCGMDAMQEKRGSRLCLLLCFCHFNSRVILLHCRLLWTGVSSSLCCSLNSISDVY